MARSPHPSVNIGQSLPEIPYPNLMAALSPPRLSQTWQSLRQLGHVGISRWTILGEGRYKRQLDPRPALVDQLADDGEGRVSHAHRRRQVPHRVKHNRRREPVE